MVMVHIELTPTTQWGLATNSTEALLGRDHPGVGRFGQAVAGQVLLPRVGLLAAISSTSLIAGPSVGSAALGIVRGPVKGLSQHAATVTLISPARGRFVARNTVVGIPIRGILLAVEALMNAVVDCATSIASLCHAHRHRALSV